MILNDTTINVKWQYRPVTKWALNWEHKSDGNWEAFDRGVAQDVYEGDIVFIGTKSELSSLETALDAEGRSGFNSSFGVGEEIFGAEIDYTSVINVIPTNYAPIKRNSFSDYTFGLRLRLVGSPSFKSLTPSLSNLRIDSWNYEAYSEYDVKNKFSYDGSLSHFDMGTDPGYFNVVCRQEPSEMEVIRRYLMLTARSNTVSFPTGIGIDEPFGQRMGTGLFTCKIVDWQDLGRSNYADWRLQLKIARVI